MLTLPSTDELDAEMCRRSLRRFIREAWPLIEAGEYKHGWHIDAIADHLEACSRGEIRRLIVNIPPRCMKSLAVSVFWPAWEWLAQPETRWMFGSYAQELALRDAVKSRTIIQTEGLRMRAGDRERTFLERVGYQGLLRLLYGDKPWKLTGDQNTKSRYENDRMGYRLASSITGQATGWGGDRVVTDDPHNVAEAESDTVRQKAVGWWDGTMSSRINDRETGVRVVVMQRVHEDDVTGHLLASGGWEHLCLPMEYEPAHPFVWPDDPRTEAGELLWPDHLPDWAVKELKHELGSARQIAGQLQQRPAPDEGAIFKREWWRYWSPHPDGPRGPDGEPLPFHELIQSWDMTFKDTDGSDFVVGQLWGRDLADLYLIRQTRKRMAFTETVEAVREMTAWAAERYPGKMGHAKLIEDAANGPAIISELRRSINGIVAITPKGSKQARAESVAPIVQGLSVHLPGAPKLVEGKIVGPHPDVPKWVDTFIEECATFPGAAHDDQVDALSQALNRLRGHEGASRKKQREQQRPVTAGLSRMDV